MTQAVGPGGVSMLDEQATLTVSRGKMPIYTGHPLSMLVRLSAPESPVQFWQWGQTTPRWNEDPYVLATLAEMGYRRVEQETDKQFYACLTSQLCDVQYVDASGPSETVGHLSAAI